MMEPSYICIVHLTSIVIPTFLMPLLIGYGIWDFNLNLISDACRSLTTLEMPFYKNSSGKWKEIIESSCCFEGYLASQVLMDDAEISSGDENQSLASLPEDKSPEKIAIWIASILLAVSITTFRVAVAYDSGNYR